MGCRDGSVRVCRLDDGKLVRWARHHHGEVNPIAINQQVVASSNFRGGPIHVMKIDSGELVHTLPGDRWCVDSLAINRSVLVSVGRKNLTQIWRLSDGALLATIRNDDDDIRCVAMAGDDVLITGGSEGSLKLWRTSNGEHLRTLLGHKGQVTEVAATARLVVSAGVDNLMKLWRLSDGTVIRTIPHRNPLLHVAINPWFVASSDNYETFIWRISDGTRWMHLREGSVSLAMESRLAIFCKRDRGKVCIVKLPMVLRERVLQWAFALGRIRQKPKQT